VPNDVLSAALQRLTAGRDLAEDEARDVAARDHGRPCRRSPDGRLPQRAARQGRDRRGDVGMARAMSALAEKVEWTPT